MISPSAEARRATLTLFGLIVVAGVLAAPAASAQSNSSSGSQGSGTNDQEVYVSGEDGGSRGSGRSCSDGSNVTVVTDEGTSHPSSGGACRNEPSPTPVQTVAANRLSSSAAATQAPSPTPETASASPVVEASPLIYLNVETPRAVSNTTGGIGTPLVVGLLIAFAAAVYLAVRAVPRIMQRDVTHMITQPEIPLLEYPSSLPLPRTIADIHVRADQPPPTEEIVIDGQLAEIHTEAP